MGTLIFHIVKSFECFFGNYAIVQVNLTVDLGTLIDFYVGLKTASEMKKSVIKIRKVPNKIKPGFWTFSLSKSVGDASSELDRFFNDSEVSHM